MKDVCILTEKRYLAPTKKNLYVKNILHEDGLVYDALNNVRLTCDRQAWDGRFDASKYRFLLFRTTWNYFDNLNLFKRFLNNSRIRPKLINPYEQVVWNLDKKYLLYFKKQGINIPDTTVVNHRQFKSLASIFSLKGWKEVVIKPCVSAASWNTYRIKISEISKFEDLFYKLVNSQSMMVQEFQNNIIKMGEVSVVMFGGKYSHAVIKSAKFGDFRVQDDFGGTYKKHLLSENEISFCDKVMSACPFVPVYARIDIIVDNKKKIALSELEIIEPELWLRMNQDSAKKFALAIKGYVVGCAP